LGLDLQTPALRRSMTAASPLPLSDIAENKSPESQSVSENATVNEQSNLLSDATPTSSAKAPSPSTLSDMMAEIGLAMDKSKKLKKAAVVGTEPTPATPKAKAKSKAKGDGVGNQD